MVLLWRKAKQDVKTQKWVKCQVWHIDLWPDPTKPKSWPSSISAVRYYVTNMQQDGSKQQATKIVKHHPELAKNDATTQIYR